MPLQLLPLQESDIPTLLTHPINDDVIGSPYDVCWPVRTEAEDSIRKEWYFKRLRHKLLHDPSARFVKVVETSEKTSDPPQISEEGTDEIISVARWHYYPNGYEVAEDAWTDWDPLATETRRREWQSRRVHDWNGDLGRGVQTADEAEEERPEGCDWVLYDEILQSVKLREQWVPKGEPCWLLLGMTTRPSGRRKGAASMLVEWGVQQAKQTRSLAGLEASAQGNKVYARQGFKQVGDLLFVDCSAVQPGLTFEMAVMTVPAEKS